MDTAATLPGLRPATTLVCPACKASEMNDVFDFGSLPVNVGVFHDDRKSALNAPMGNIVLALCSDCGFVHNRAFDAATGIFNPGYEVALHHSETFRTFIRGVAERLIERYDLRGKRVLEIGCGDGYFLRTLAELGGNHGIGIDPTVSQPGLHRAGEGSVRFIRDYFGPQHEDQKADFICCLSVFEDIPRPAPFLQSVHRIASRTGAPLYFEVFNAQRAFDQGEVWSVHYEQCNYFGLNSLRNLFARHGFEVDQSGACYQGDQYIFVEAHPENALQSPSLETFSNPEPLVAFAELFDRKRHEWSHRLAKFRREGQRVVLWGTGGKGITFLNAVDGTETIEFVAEINPDKQGRFVPGTGQRIVAPEFLSEYRPDKIIITNVLYEAEMKRQAEDLGVDAEFLVA